MSAQNENQKNSMRGKILSPSQILPSEIGGFLGMAQLKMVEMEKIGKNRLSINEMKGKDLQKIFVKPKLPGPRPKTRFRVPLCT